MKLGSYILKPFFVSQIEIFLSFDPHLILMSILLAHTCSIKFINIHPKMEWETKTQKT